MKRSRTAMLHYAAPPVVGGVEAVIDAHVRAFVAAGYAAHGAVAVIAGRGAARALPSEVAFVHVPEVDSQHPRIAAVSARLQEGEVPGDFEELANRLVELLAPELADFDNLIVHNAFTKRFNLPLTAALFRLLDRGDVPNCIAWCHDVGWTSAHSRPNLHPGYPWDLLRTRRADVTYVVVSEHRQRALAELFECPREEIRVVHNGVDPPALLGLTEEGRRLIQRLDLLSSDLILLMPVRVTQAKNVELALRVVAALKARGLGVKLVLTGPPDPHDEESMAYFRQLQALRRELGVEEEMRFVAESGPDPDEPYTIGMDVVADLFRVSDVMFMPSHREGFGMPVLEAGLVGIPVVCTPVPAAREIGGEEVTLISPDGNPEDVADVLLSRVEGSPVHRLRRRVRQGYTWSAIFRRDIEPLLVGGRGGVTLQAPVEVKRRIAEAERLRLFLDYDGTLANFAPTPEHVEPDPEVGALIARLARHPALRVAVISGRRLSHVEELVLGSDAQTGLPVLLAGTYGVELRLPDGERVHRVPYDEIRPVLEAVKPRWEELIAGRDGFFLEDKDWALAIHGKCAAADEAEEVLEQARRLAKKAVQAAARPDQFRILGGHKFLEIGPALAHKGKTVAYLLQRYPWPGALPVYVGDDDKDEEAFGVIHAHDGVAVRVCDEPCRTQADGRLPSPQHVRRWLATLLPPGGTEA